MSRLRANQITNENANGAPNFPHGLTVTGIVTASVGGQNISGDLTVSGNTTLTGNLGVGGTITYEDVANVDSVGIITARAGINLTGGNITLGDSGGSTDDRIKLGAGGDIEIYHDGSDSHIHNSTSNLRVRSNDIQLRDNAENFYVDCNNGGSVDLYHNGTKKIETTAAGVTVTGTVTDSKGDVRKLTVNAQSGDYTLVVGDAGKFIRRTGGNVTIPDDVFATGDMVTIINDAGSTMTITQGSGFTIYNTADATTGNRTLAARGMATILFNSTEQGYMSGAGLS